LTKTQLGAACFTSSFIPLRRWDADACVVRCATPSETISNTNNPKSITGVAMATTLTTKGQVTIPKPIRADWESAAAARSNSRSLRTGALS
jgi:hypothetical protein